MLQWLWNVLGVNQINGQDKSALVLPVLAPPVAIDPVIDTQEFSQVEVDKIRLEAEAVAAEQEVQQALDTHMETISDADPKLKLLSQQLRDLEQDQAQATS